MTVPMRFRQYIQVKAGENPDPAVFCPAEGYILPEDCPVPDPEIYCPANGYIPDEPGAGSWVRIAFFKTEATTNFNPTLSMGTTLDEDVVWVVDDAQYEGKSPTFPELSGALVDVEVYVRFTGTTQGVSNINLDGDDIVGRVDISHSIFDSCKYFYLYDNPKMTGFILSETFSAEVAQLYMYNTGISGILDLSMMTKFSAISGVTFWLYNNPYLQGINFATTIDSGYLLNLYVYSCNLTGTIDISMFKDLRPSTSSGSAIRFDNNPNLNYIKIPSSIDSGYLGNFQANDCDLKVELDFSGCTRLTTSSSYFRLYNNLNLPSIKLPTSITAGCIRGLLCYNCNLTGTLDLSNADILYSTGTSFQFNNNPNLTNVIFPSSYTGQINNLHFYNCDLTGTIDISSLTAFSSLTGLRFENNPNLTGFTMPASTSGNIMYFDFFDCDITGTLDLSMFTMRAGNTYIRFYNNSNLTGVLLPIPTTGSISYYTYGYSCALTTIDFSGWTGVLDYNSVKVKLNDNLILETDVDQILADLDNITSGGYTSRRIEIAGTNEPPSAAGLTSKANLETKGFTVYTN